MERIKDESFGVVPMLKKNGEWRVLLVHQISHRGGEHRFWTFPKGHPEEGETIVETAIRELVEETGITDVQIIEKAQFPVSYQFEHEGQMVDKTVIYFLGLCSNTQTTISQPEEIAEIGWFSIKEATEKITHKNAQSVLLATAQYVQEYLV